MKRSIIIYIFIGILFVCNLAPKSYAEMSKEEETVFKAYIRIRTDHLYAAKKSYPIEALKETLKLGKLKTSSDLSRKMETLAKDNPNEVGISKEAEIILEVYKKLKTEYPKIHFNKIIDSLLSPLKDKYSFYISEEEFKRMEENRNREEAPYAGIMYLCRDDGPYVINVASKSPAEKAGVCIGDKVEKINGKQVTNSNDFFKIWDSLSEGSVAKLQLNQKGKIKNVSITVEKILTPLVTSEIFPTSNIGYIRVHRFLNGTAKEFSDHMKKIKNHSTKGFILDLRCNTGGDPDQLLHMVSHFFKEGISHRFTTRQSGEKNYKIKNGENFDKPIAVLTDSCTGSSAELMVSTMKSKKNTVHIGKKHLEKE